MKTLDPSRPFGTLDTIWRYPIKSLRGERLKMADVRLDGIVGDRHSMLVVQNAGHARAGKAYRGKEHNLLHTFDNVDLACEAAAAAGVTVELRGDGPHFDDAPISLLLDTWLAEAELLTGMRLDPLRFRPNLFARAAIGFTGDEHALIGKRIGCGSVVLRVVDPDVRCVTTTYDVATGARSPIVLEAMAQHRGAVMGVYCEVELAGSVRLGDELRLLS